MRLGIGAGTLLAFALLGAAAQARAGLFDDDEARARVDRLRGEVAEHARRLDTAAGAQLDLSNQIESLKAEVARLRGQIEVQSYEAEAAKKRQTDFYSDLDARLRKFESAQTEAKAPAEQAAEADSMAETRDYETALGAYKAAKYREAAAAFEAFIKAYPKSALLPGAHYWAASGHFQLREFGKSAELFATLAQTWPGDPRAADALMGQANSQEQGGDAKGMKKALETLVAKYPDSSAAQAAKLRLKKK